jgi:hypothetical protein
MYERRKQRPLSHQQFLRRLGKHVVVACILAIWSLGFGMAGYFYLEDLGWEDSFLNAAMLLGGMGPVETQNLNTATKLFAGFYALYSGLVFVLATGIIVAPILHRLLHRFHWDED